MSAPKLTLDYTIHEHGRVETDVNFIYDTGCSHTSIPMGLLNEKLGRSGLSFTQQTSTANGTGYVATFKGVFGLKDAGVYIPHGEISVRPMPGDALLGLDVTDAWRTHKKTNTQWTFKVFVAPR